jgi:hypothetical protein
MRIIWAFLLITYVVVQVVCFVDCIPIQLYWQGTPPGGETNVAPTHYSYEYLTDGSQTTVPRQ